MGLRPISNLQWSNIMSISDSIVLSTIMVGSSINIMNLGKCWIYKQQRPSEFCISSFTISNKKEEYIFSESIMVIDDIRELHKRSSSLFLDHPGDFIPRVKFLIPISNIN